MTATPEERTMTSSTAPHRPDPMTATGYGSDEPTEQALADAEDALRLLRTAQPRKRTVRDSYGDPCVAAQPDDYPLRAQCDNCGVSIQCADGTADWFHIGTRRGQCADRLGTVR